MPRIEFTTLRSGKIFGSHVDPSENRHRSNPMVNREGRKASPLARKSLETFQKQKPRRLKNPKQKRHKMVPVKGEIPEKESNSTCFGLRMTILSVMLIYVSFKLGGKLGCKLSGKEDCY